MSDFHPYLKRAVSGTPLSSTAMEEAMALMLKGIPKETEIAGFLVALRTRGETVEEIGAAAKAMRQMSIRVEAPEDVVDTAGTGGDGAGTYNISTASALIAAGAGVQIAKHGNRAATSKSGSSDVLAELGINLNAKPATISKCILEANIGFMFAAYHHQAVAHVASVRKSLGVRTIFNVLGPLTNPAGAKRQVIGVFDRKLCKPMAQTLHALGSKHVWIVHGEDGLDELTTTSKSYVCALQNGEISEFEICPEDVGLPRASISSLEGGTPQQNADALRRLLDSEKSPYRDISILNASAALIVADKVNSISDGIAMAQTSIDSGKASEALNKLVTISNTKL